MSDLEQLTLLMGEVEDRAVRLGYALGWHHGRTEDRDCDLDIYVAPEFRVLDEMGLPS